MLKLAAKKIKSALRQYQLSRLGKSIKRLLAAYGVILVAVAMLLLTAVIIGNSYRNKATCTANPFKYYSGAVEQLAIGDQAYVVAFAQSADQKTNGLSGTVCLPTDNAMLFDYSSQPEIAAIWMKDMKYSIDIVWLDDEGKIITIAAEVAPESYPSTFQPTSAASYVLEFAAGESKRNNWQVGETLLRL